MLDALTNDQPVGGGSANTGGADADALLASIDSLMGTPKTPAAGAKTP